MNILKNRLCDEFRKILPHDFVIDKEEGLRPYECDGLTAYCELPLVAVLPDTVLQVRKIMRICSDMKVPVVARGAATGLSGGALPLANGVLLCLSKLKNILDVDPLARTARVQPGVRNQAISDACADFGLYYAPDPSSQIACTIGGNVAENSGGVHCLKYGLTVNNILELKIVTASGDLITAGSASLDSVGYDLLALMTGSEGMLGIVVEILVKLLPKPESTKLLLAAFDDVEVAADAVGEIIGSGIIPAGLEMLDNFAIIAAEDFVHAGYPRDAAGILLCEIDGNNEEVIKDTERVRDLLIRFGAKEVRVARDEAERLLFWKGRKSAFPAIGRLSPDYYCIDSTVPRRHLAEILRNISMLAKKYQLRVANVFHAGDGNLHPLILYDASKKDELKRAEKFGAEIMEISVKLGGAITGEHGVGFEKIQQMYAQFSSDELQQFYDVKTVFDPLWILNPGKGIPQPKKCSEYKALGNNTLTLPSKRVALPSKRVLR